MNAEVKQTEYQLTMAAQPACPRMTIVIHSMGMPFDGDTVRTASLGGSESAAYYQARELAARGHRVMLFTNCKESSVTDGVMYFPIGEISQEKPLGYNFELYARNTPHDVLIIQRHPLAFHGQFASKINIWQLHDLALIRSAGMVNAQMWNVDAVTCVSEWHKKQVCEIYGFDPEFVRMVPNGVDEELYKSRDMDAEEHMAGIRGQLRDSGKMDQNAFLMLYQSRPERGLEHLVRPGGIMDRLRDTNAHLLICGYENTTAEMAPVYQKWFAWADALPNVTRLGALTKPQLAALQKSCDLLVYPTSFEEVSPLRGDAVIDMPGGRETIESLWKAGRENFYVWSWSHAEARMVLAKANRIIRTRQNAQMITIRMKPKTGCKAKCETTLTLTPDHEVMLRDGSYCRADRLMPGMSLMPFGRSPGFGRFKKPDGEVAKYWYVSRKNLGDRVPEHRYVMEQMLGRKLKTSEIVDHIDGDTSNNDPSNLQIWGSHSEHLTDHWARLEVDEANVRKTERAASIHAYHDSLTGEELSAVKRKAAMIRWHGHAENHVVVSVETAENADAYCMEVDGTHNFIANGIAVHNCITAMEAMHAGLPMLTSDVAALRETCNGSEGVQFRLLVDGKVDEDAFVYAIRAYWITADLKQERTGQLETAESRTWSAAVDQMEAMLADLHVTARGTPAARLKHCIEHSDIEFARNLTEANPKNSIMRTAKREIEQLYAFTKSTEAYAAHYDKHQSAYYDEFREQVIGEDVRESARFRAVRSIIGPALDGRDDVRVLDYGCAHGHYLMPLAAEFPNAQFTGMDISARAIGAAMEWAKRANITNVELIIGDQSRLAPHFVCPREKISKIEMNDTGDVYELGEPILFDVIYAGEVLEHVPDWLGLLEQFRTVLKPGGLLIVTTPLGRWEWTGTAAFREAREHLHHFDKDDILELCGANPVQTLCAPAGADQTGRALGSWVWGVTVDGPFEPYDIERKLESIVPRQTVSACLIVKDGERTLRKCVESIVDWVDEVVIAIDPTTKDRTQQIAEQLQVDYQWRAFTIVRGKSAIKDGFDAARNVTLEHATGDWILWLDADEEVQQPQNLWKYLRQSQHQAFGFPQVHYACDPPQVLTTDYPCRLFRNNGKIKFYGVVHEHPEVEAGKAIPFATIKTDVQFLHAGYVNESVRRKRYERNLPLLTRDIKQHPERKLNTFLWLRDIAQGIMFHVERQGGYATEAQVEQAREGIKVFENLVDDQAGNMRMILDSVPYYSQCVMLLQTGFDVDTTFKLSKPPHNDLNCNASIKGRFHSIACYEKLLGKLTAEATKHYESKYL